MFVIFAVFALTSTTIACSADYLIWMIRDKSADPLYRFVRGEKVGYINRMGKVVIPPSSTSQEITATNSTMAF